MSGVFAFSLPELLQGKRRIAVMSFTQLNVFIIQLCWNLWHMFLPKTAVNASGSLRDIPQGNWFYQKPAHHQITSILLPFLFAVQWVAHH